MLTVAETPRLVVRTWQEQDLKAYGQLLGEDKLSGCFSHTKPTSRAETEIWRYQTELDLRGWSRWAVVLKESNGLIGNCGFSPYGEEVELSWSFAREHRGRGLVTEAVQAVTGLGFERFGFRKLITFAASDNNFALEVIAQLGMSLDRFEGWSSLTVARYSLCCRDRTH